tara:strand:- start:246 stop:818 length:573 start_codon:yes stop_codon:yes gene_type:complete
MPKKILKGFTLIELLVVVAIIGILSAIGVVAYSKYSSMAQIKAIKAQNKEMNDFVKTQILTQCINYSDEVSIKYGSNNRIAKAACNKNNNEWHTVSGMYRPFKYYFSWKSDFKNVIQSHNQKNGIGGSCPNRASADQSMKPGNHCISYESLGSRDFSKNACSNNGYSHWLIIGSMLPDKSYHFSCVGKTW